MPTTKKKTISKTKSASAAKTRVIARREREVVIALPDVKVPRFLQGFVDFVREQGVVGLAVGLILGFAAKTLIDSLVQNIFNPLVGLLTGGISLENKVACVREVANQCTTNIRYGKFLSDLISFLIVAAVVYFVVKGLKLEKLDKKKEEEKK